MGAEMVLQPASVFLLKVFVLSLFYYLVSFNYLDKIIFLGLCAVGAWAGREMSKKKEETKEEAQTAAQVLLLYWSFCLAE